jgi:LL-diaminopimelate aminotransferase
VVQAIRTSVDSPALSERAPVKGYPFLLEAIVKSDFKARKLKIGIDDIFVNAGTKQDIAGISDILCKDNRIALLDPTSQIYVKSNVIGYRAGILEENKQWSNIVYLSVNKDNGYMPVIPEERFDIVFFSSPNNPTGMALSREILTKWVNYAISNNVIILFDATYEAFISDSNIPRSIYEIKGAQKVAIEFHSFAKNAGFTGIHCGYTVIPKEITSYSLTYDRNVGLCDLWTQRQIVKNNVPSYILQRAAEAIYSPKGKRETQAQVDYYMMNIAMLRQTLQETSLRFCGGENSPYLWIQSPDGNAWNLFDSLLNECHIVSVPGEMYGGNPDGCVRLSGFAARKDVANACENIRKELK